MSKHTPGPWRVGGSTGCLHQIGIEPSIGCAYGATDSLHNARLMAAAPELLAALERASELLSEDRYADALRQCRAAIAKATVPDHSVSPYQVSS